MRSRLSSVTTPRLKVSRRPSRVKSPRRIVRPPVTVGAAGVPATSSWPDISASRPRPRTNTACGARIDRARRTGAAPGGGAARGGGLAGAGRTTAGAVAAPPALLISRTSRVGKAADCSAPTAISARSMVMGPATLRPPTVDPVTLTLLETLATRSGRLTSKALRLVTVRSGTRPCCASSRMVPVTPTPPPRAVWKLSRCTCSVSPCRTNRPSPPLSRSPDSGMRHGAVGEVDAAVAGHARTGDLDRQVRAAACR